VKYTISTTLSKLFGGEYEKRGRRKEEKLKKEGEDG
jgi:hypothetical protein